MNFIFFLFSLFLFKTYSFKVDYFWKTGNDENSYAKLFEDYLESKEVNVTFKAVEYTSFDNFETQMMNEFTVSKVTLFYVKCVSTDFFNMDYELLKENGIVVWCVNWYAIGACSNSFIPGNSVVSPMKNLQFSITNLANYESFLGGSVLHDYDIFLDVRIRKSGHIFGEGLIYNYSQGSIDTAIINDYVAFLEQNYKHIPVFTITTITQIDVMNHLLSILYINESVETRPILFYPGSISNFTGITDQSKLTGNYVFDIYDDAINTNLSQFKENFSSVGILDSQNCFIAGLVDLLVYGLGSTNSDTAYDLLPTLYNKRLSYLCGEIEVLPNNNIATTWYVKKFNAIQKKESHSQFTIQANFQPDEQFDVYYDNQCDLHEIDSNSTTLSVIKLLIISTLSTSLNDKALVMELHFLIDYYNLNKPILGKTLQAVSITFDADTGDEVREAIEKVNSYADDDISVAFLYTTVVTQLLIIPKINPKIQIFYLGKSIGEDCNYNVVYCDMINKNYIKLVSLHIRENADNPQIFVIGSNSPFGEQTRALLRSTFIMDDGYTEAELNFADLRTETETECNNTIQIVNRTMPEGGYVIITAEERYNTLLYKSMTILDKSLFHVVSFTVDELSALQSPLNQYVDDTYIINHYSDSYHYSTKSAIFEQFRTTISSYLGFSVPLTSLLGIAYNAFQQWSTAVSLSTPKPENYKAYLYHQVTLDPVSGPYEIYYNGYAQGMLQLVKINGISDYSSITQDYYARRTLTFHNQSLICSFKDASGLFVKPTTQYKVGVLWNINTIFGSKRYEELQMFLDLLNQDGGIDGRELRAVTTKYDDNSTHLEQYVLQLANDTDLLFFMGTKTLAERAAINRTLIEYDKLCFSFETSPGEVSYPNIIFFNRLPHQSETYSLYWAFQRYRSFSILYDTDSEEAVSLANYANKLGIDSKIPPKNIYQYNSTANNLATLSSMINTALSSETESLLYLLIGEQTDSFMVMYQLNDTEHPILIGDFTRNLIKNSTAFRGHFGETHYAPETKNPTNAKLVENIESYKGKSTRVLNKYSVLINSILSVVKQIVENNIEKSSELLRFTLYEQVYDTPMGQIKVFPSNYANSFSTIVQCQEDSSLKIIYEFVDPINPLPFHPLNNNNQYFEISYGFNSTKTKGPIEYVGIAYLFEISPKSSSFLDYTLSRIPIEQTNFAGGIKRFEIISELIQCPKDETSAAGLILGLQKRSFTLLIGGCDAQHRSYTRNVVEALNLVLFYTGLNSGFDCSKNIRYISSSPAQSVIPAILHFIYLEGESPIVFYSSASDFASRVALASSTYEAFPVTILLERAIPEDDSYQNIIKTCVNLIKKSFPNGGPILLLLRGIYLEYFLDYFYTRLFVRTGQFRTITEFTSFYRLYIIDDSHTYFPNGGHFEGGRLYTPYLERNTDAVQTFHTIINHIALDLHPTYLNTLANAATLWLLQILKDVMTVDCDSILTQTYKTKVETTLGLTISDASNHVTQDFLTGIIDKNGIVQFDTVLSRAWYGDPWRSVFNTNKLERCDWIDEKKEKEDVVVTRIVMFLPAEKIYRRDAVLFYDSLFTGITMVNNDLGGLGGYYLLGIVLSDKDDPDYVTKEVINYCENFNAKVFFGGFTAKIREAVQIAAVEHDAILFCPVDFEGDESYSRVFYNGAAFQSYYVLFPWIMSSNQGIVITLYSDSHVMTQYHERFLKDLNSYNLPPVISISLPVGQHNLTYVLNTIKRLNIPRGMIVSFLDKGDAVHLFDAMKNNGLVPPSFTSISLTLDDLDIYDLKEKTIGHYYWDTYLHEPEKNKLQKEYENKMFSLFSFYPTFSTLMEKAIDEILAFVRVRQLMNTVTVKEMRDLLYSTTFTLLRGDAHFTAGNFMGTNLYIKTVTATGLGDIPIIDTVYSNQEVIYTYPYGCLYHDSIIKRCDWRDEVNKQTTYPTIKIGMIFSTTGVNRPFERRSIHGTFLAVYKMYGLDPLLDHYITIKQFDYKSDLDYLKAQLPIFLEDKDIKVLVGCSARNCKAIVADYLQTLENSIPYFYSRTSLGQECNPYIYHTGLVPDQFMNRLLEYLITTPYLTNLYLVMDEIHKEFSFDELVKDASSGLYSFKQCFYVRDDNPITIELINNITAEMPNGGVIITGLTQDDLSKFLQVFQKMRLDSEKYAVVDLLLEQEHVETIDPSLRKDLYKFSRYFSDIPTDTNTAFRQSVFHYTSQSQPTGMLEGTYGGLMLWHKTVSKVKSFDANLIRQGIHGESIEIGSGTLTMTENNYATTPFFVAKYGRDGKDLVTLNFKYETEIPLPWSWNVEASYGKKCNFSNNKINTNYSVPVQRVLLAASLTGDQSGDAYGLVDSFQLAVNEINGAGGVGGYTIKADVIDMQSQPQICYSLLSSFIISKNPLVVFAAIDEECQTKLIDSELLDTKKLLFFQISAQKLGFCNQNVAVAVKHVTLYEPVVNIIHSRFYYQVILFGTPNNEAIEYVNIELLKLKVNVSSYTEDLSNTILLKEQLEKYTDTGACLCLFGKIEHFILIMEVLTSIPQHTLFHVIVLEDSHHIRELKEYYSFHYEIFNFYDNDLDNPENTKYKEAIYKRITKTKYVTDIMIRLYSSLMLWAKAINQLPIDTKDVNGNPISSLDSAAIRSALRNVSFSGPAGVTKFGKNNYLSRIAYITKLNDDGKATLIYTSQIPRTPQAWGMSAANNFVKCDFTDNGVGSKKELKTYLVLVFYSLTGSESRKEALLYHTLAAALDRINEDGGLLGSMITHLLFDAESKPQRYAELSAEAVKNNSVVYIFGGYSAETLAVVGPVLNGQNQGWLYAGKTYGDVCYWNMFVTGTHEIILARSVLRRLLEMSSSAYLIYANTKYSIANLDWVNKVIKSLQITTNGVSMIDVGKKAVSDIKLALPTSGYIINMIDDDDLNLQFYAYLGELGMIAPNYIVINMFIDENLIHKINPKYTVGHILMGTYFESLADSTKSTVAVPYLASLFNQDVHYKLGDVYPNSDQEVAYMSVLLWKAACIKANSFGVAGRANMYLYPVDSPSNQLEAYYNDHSARRVYAATIQADQSLYVDWGPTALFQPDIYYTNNASEIGYTCEMNGPEPKPFIFTDPIIISFLHERDIGGKTEQYNSLILDLTIDEINNLGGVLGRSLAAVHRWVVINDAYKTAREIIEEGKSSLIVGCLTPECRTEASRYLANQDSLFLFTGRDDGYSCHENTIIVGLTILQKLEPLFAYLSNLGITTLYVVGSYRNSSQTEFYALQQFANKSNYPILGHSFFSPFNQESIDKCSRDLESLIDVNTKVGVIDLFVAKENSLFLASFLKNTVVKASVTVILMNYDPSDFSKSTRSLLVGSYIVSSYGTAVKNTLSGSFQYSATAKYQKGLELAEITENSYSSLFIWKAAVEYAQTKSGEKWPSNDYIKLSLKYITTDTPSGSTRVQTNNHVTKPVFIFRITENEITQVYPKQGLEYSVDPTMVYKSTDECQFAKRKELYQYDPILRVATIVIASIDMISAVFIIVLVTIFRNSKIIKNASPLFLYYSLFSVILLSASGLIFIFEPDSDVVCGLRNWGLAISVDLFFSILFCKAWRIHKLFNNKELQRVKVSNGQLMEMVGLILGVQMLYLMVWWLVDPSVPIQVLSDTYSNFLTDVYIRECTENLIFVIIQLVAVCLLFLWGTKMAWGVRNASSEFNESMSLMSTIALILILGILEIPLNYLLSSEPDTLLLIRSFGIVIGTFAILLLQFGSKIVYLYTVEMSTSFGSSNQSGKSSGERSKAMKNAASRGGYTVFPDLLRYSGMALSTLSAAERFYDDPSLVVSTTKKSVRESSRNLSGKSGVS